MKQGFTQTLMMCAILVMAAQAMASAPVISEIPSPVVGDQETATPSNTFVYPDAFDLTTKATDDTLSQSAIVWSYETLGSPQVYSINGVPIMGGSDNFNDPANTGKAIAGPGASDLDVHNDTTSHTQDSNPNTITIRNILLSPIGGPNVAPDAAKGAYPQDVVFYASDGDLFTTRTVTLYTSTGFDHMSNVGIPIVSTSFGSGTTAVPDGWSLQKLGQLTTTVNANGVCMDVTGVTNQDSFGFFFAPFGELPLVKNSAYRIRLVMNGTQQTLHQVPIWDLVLDNSGSSVGPPPLGPGNTAYAADFILWDNAFTNNGAPQLTKGDTTFDFWWTPPPVLNARWNDATEASDTSKSGPFAPSQAVNNYVQIFTRVFDPRLADSNTGNLLQCLLNTGSLCMKDMSVTRYDLTDPNALVADPTLVYQQPPTGASWSLAPASGTGPAGCVRTFGSSVFGGHMGLTIDPRRD
jgi:hypothetical protein